MASYKVEVRKQFGRFQARFFPAGGSAEEKPFQDLEDVVEFVRGEVGALNLKSDSVIFRGIAYSNVGELERAVKTAPY